MVQIDNAANNAGHDQRTLLVNILGDRTFERLATNRPFMSRALTDHGFTESVTPFFDILGGDNFLRLMRNSYFVRRILNTEFNALMHLWLANLGPEVFVRLASNRRVVARLGNPALQDQLTRLRQTMPSFDEFMVGSRQVTDAEFVGCVEFLLLRQ